MSSTFDKDIIPNAYVRALVDLINACDKHNVKINKVIPHFNGFCVTFEGYDHADAALHDETAFYTSNDKNNWNYKGRWETIGFPWDKDDVSCHTAEHLAQMLEWLNQNEDYDESWEDFC